jgi:F0F1-type ATP synthase membrane subunit c/vacuolar-type H+-ATPase subunit K
MIGAGLAALGCLRPGIGIGILTGHVDRCHRSQS